MRIGNSFKQKEITSEAMSLKATRDVDPALRASLTDADEGILRPGMLPKVGAATAAGSKALLNTLEKAGCNSTLLPMILHSLARGS